LTFKAAPVQPNAGRLPGLDALRGIAAFCVVVMHTQSLYPEFPRYSGKAYLAVDFFFALSGYVMARTYERRLAAGFSASQFFFARYRRLWPTMAIGGLLFLPFLYAAAPDGVLFTAMALLNLALVPTLAASDIFPLNVPAWSVFYELVANVLHGFWLWQARLRWLLAMIAVAFVVLALAGRANGSLDIGSGQGEWIGGLARVVFSYGLGIVIWRWRGDRASSRFWIVPTFLAMPVLFAVPVVAPLYGWPFDLAVIAIASPLILIGGLAIRGSSWLALRAGELSFPLYAVHFPMLFWFRKWGLVPEAAVLMCLPVAAMVAYVTVMFGKQRKATAVTL